MAMPSAEFPIFTGKINSTQSAYFFFVWHGYRPVYSYFMPNIYRHIVFKNMTSAVVLKKESQFEYLSGLKHSGFGIIAISCMWR